MRLNQMLNCTEIANLRSLKKEKSTYQSDKVKKTFLSFCSYSAEDKLTMPRYGKNISVWTDIFRVLLTMGCFHYS